MHAARNLSESGSRCDGISFRQFFLVVVVDFDKGDFVGSRELCGELLVDGCYLYTWTTPVGIDLNLISKCMFRGSRWKDYGLGIVCKHVRGICKTR